MRAMEVLGVRVELPRTEPLLVLKETDGTRYLPIWLGANEAAAIANQLDHVEFPRPFTHDLAAALLRELNAEVTAVHITEVADGTFYARLVVGEHEFDARPSDAIALALRFDAPILAADEVLDEVGVEVGNPQAQEAEVEKFREFLESVDADDFDA